MILIDPRMLESLKTPAATAPLQDSIASSMALLEGEMKRQLDAPTANAHLCVLNYQQALQKFLNLADQYRDRPLGKVEIMEPKDTTKPLPQQQQQTSEKEARMEETVVNSVPRSLKRKTRLLLDHIKDIPSVTWSERGELVVDGQPVVGSNVTDLINDVVRKRKTVGAPHGWQAFAEVLKDANTSRELIANPDRWNVIGPAPDRSRSRVRGRRKRRVEPSPVPTGGKRPYITCAANDTATTTKVVATLTVADTTTNS